MPNYTIKTTPIEGVLILEPNDNVNPTTCKWPTAQELTELGITEKYKNKSEEKLARGVLRGLHFNTSGVQAKLVRVTAGAALNVAADLRYKSYTYGASHGVELSGENGRILYIPAHFAHGFLTLEPGTEITIKSSGILDTKKESGVQWDDQILAIDWQYERYDIDQKWLNIAPKDKKRTTFRQLDARFLWDE